MVRGKAPNRKQKGYRVMATTTNKVTRVDAIETAAAFIRAHEDAWDAFGCEYAIADIIANLEEQASKMRTSAAKKRSTPTKMEPAHRTPFRMMCPKIPKVGIA